MEVRPAWQRPEVVRPFLHDTTQRMMDTPWARLGRLRTHVQVEEGRKFAVFTRQELWNVVGLALQLKSAGAQRSAIERLESLGVVRHAARDEYHFFVERLGWSAPFVLNKMKAGWARLSGIDDLDLARFTAHQQSRESPSDWLPPPPAGNYAHLDEDSVSLHALMGLQRHPAVRVSYELVMWVHVVHLWESKRILKRPDWTRTQLKDTFGAQGLRTSNLAIQQVAKLGTVLGVVKANHHGKLRMGWSVVPWMRPVADGFLNHVVDSEGLRTFDDCMVAAERFHGDFTAAYGPVEACRNDVAWKAVLREWKAEMKLAQRIHR